MKIYMLMMLIAVIVGLSHLPIRVRAKQSAYGPPDSVPLDAYGLSKSLRFSFLS
jgi:hypothetical protein